MKFRSNSLIGVLVVKLQQCKSQAVNDWAAMSMLHTVVL